MDVLYIILMKESIIRKLWNIENIMVVLILVCSVLPFVGHQDSIVMVPRGFKHILFQTFFGI